MTQHFLESFVDENGEILTSLICTKPDECSDEGRGCLYEKPWDNMGESLLTSPEKVINFGKIEVSIYYLGESKEDDDLYFELLDNAKVQELPWFIDDSKNISCQDCLRIIGPADSPGTLASLETEISSHIQKFHTAE